MKFLFSTGSLRDYGIARIFELAAQAGFDGIEVMVNRYWDSRDPNYLKRLMELYHLPILALHTPFDTHIKNWCHGKTEAIQKTVRLAEEIGALVVVHHLPSKIKMTKLEIDTPIGKHKVGFPLPMPDRDPHTRWLMDEDGYVAFQATTHVALCIENMPSKRFLGRAINWARWNVHNEATADDITRFSAITMDTTHLATWNLDPTDIYMRWRPRVKHIHLSNFNGREHTRPEDGVLRLDRLLQQLKHDKYTGTITMELRPEALDAGREDAHVLSRMMTSLQHCREWAG